VFAFASEHDNNRRAICILRRIDNASHQAFAAELNKLFRPAESGRPARRQNHRTDLLHSLGANGRCFLQVVNRDFSFAQRFAGAVCNDALNFRHNRQRNFFANYRLQIRFAVHIFLVSPRLIGEALNEHVPGYSPIARTKRLARIYKCICLGLFEYL